MSVAGPPPRTVQYCPWCASKMPQPILVPMVVIERARYGEKSRWVYACQLCDYEESYRRPIG